MSKFIVIEPEEIEKARHLYEDTSLPIIDIAISLGVSQTTFLNRAKLWGWKTRRQRFVALDKAAKKESEAAQEIREIAAILFRRDGRTRRKNPRARCEYRNASDVRF